MKSLLLSFVALACCATVDQGGALAQDCSLNTYGSSFSGTCRTTRGHSYNVEGSEYGPTRIHGTTRDGDRFRGTTSPGGGFRGTVNGQWVQCYGGRCW